MNPSFAVHGRWLCCTPCTFDVPSSYPWWVNGHVSPVRASLATPSNILKGARPHTCPWLLFLVMNRTNCSSFIRVGERAETKGFYTVVWLSCKPLQTTGLAKKFSSPSSQPSLLETSTKNYLWLSPCQSISRNRDRRRITTRTYKNYCVVLKQAPRPRPICSPRRV